MKELCRLNIQYCADREKIITALANSGYTIKVEREERRLDNDKYWVIVYEISDKEKE